MPAAQIIYQRSTGTMPVPLLILQPVCPGYTMAHQTGGILLTCSYISSVYKNDNGVFTDINAGLPGLGFGSASWADYDSDGDLDILITGYTGQRTAKIYKNDAGVFTEISAA